MRDRDPYGYFSERAGTLEYGERPMFPKRDTGKDLPETPEQEADRLERTRILWDRLSEEAEALARKHNEIMRGLSRGKL